MKTRVEILRILWLSDDGKIVVNQEGGFRSHIEVLRRVRENGMHRFRVESSFIWIENDIRNS